VVLCWDDEVLCEDQDDRDDSEDDGSYSSTKSDWKVWSDDCNSYSFPGSDRWITERADHDAIVVL